VANPLHALSEILASLHHPDGTVAVDGFYDGIPELSPRRRREIAGVAFDEARYLAELGGDRGARRGGVQHARAALNGRRWRSTACAAAAGTR